MYYLFQRVVRYILKQDIPSSLEDALKVAQGYRLSDDEVYSLRIIDLIDREQVWSFKLCHRAAWLTLSS